MIELNCMGCGKSFNRTLREHNKNLRRGRTIIACSNACVGKTRSKNTKSTTAKCVNCGIEFSRKQTGPDKMKFCSHACSSKYNRKQYTCIKCGNIAFTQRRVCEECKIINRYSRRIDWNSTTLQDLKDKYSLSQYHAKLRGMSRSEYKRHGGPMTCAVDGYNLHVDICHIKDVKDFPMTSTIAEVNNITNLIALCKRCHWEFDNGYLVLNGGEGPSRTAVLSV